MDILAINGKDMVGGDGGGWVRVGGKKGVDVVG